MIQKYEEMFERIKLTQQYQKRTDFKTINMKKRWAKKNQTHPGNIRKE